MPVVVVASGWAAQLITPQPFVVGLFPQGALADWGQRAEQLVPSGSQLLAPPLDWGVRMATKRAVVADCKYGPYGGDAWKEYKARIEAMGGFDQCLGTQGAKTYDDLPGETLVEVARRYHADFIIVETFLTPETRNVRESRVSVPESTEPPRPTGSDQKDSLTRMGWTVLLGPEEEVPFYLLKAPASTP
jgi:hypothetical protein